MAEIKYVGLDEAGLDGFESRKLHDTLAHYAERLERIVHNTVELVTHLKAYDKAGERRKFSVHLRMTYPGATIVSDKKDDWNALTAVQRSLDALEEQVKHRLKKD
jgi:hypothetical protein